MNEPAYRPTRSNVLAAIVVGVPLVLLLLHGTVFGVWLYPYGAISLAGVAIAGLLLKTETLRVMTTRELLAPVVEPGWRRTSAIGVTCAIELVALTLGGTRLYRRHVVLGQLQAADACVSESVDAKEAAELDLGSQRQESVALCATRREVDAKRAAAQKCNDLVSSLSKSDASVISNATEVAEPERSVLLRTARASLIAADLGVAKAAFSACDGRLWPIYVKGVASAVKAWGDLSSDSNVTDDLRRELGGGKQKMSKEAAAALSANAEGKAQKAPTTDTSDVFAGVDSFCLFAEYVTHTPRGPACAVVAKKVKRAEAIQEAKTKADESKQLAKQKTDDAHEQARTAATQRCMAACERVDPDMGDRWAKCTDRCTGMDKLDGPLPF
jgi:hypothetical protein